MAKKSTSTLPIRHSAHIKEDDSLIIFRKTVSPWVVYDIKNSADYGIDASVEITKDKIKSEDKLVTGKRFNVQLKSTRINIKENGFSVSIKRSTFLYWYQCTQPVLLVLVNLLDKTLYYIWVDDSLLASINKKNPNWHANETITIKAITSQTLNSKSLIKIENFVYKWTYKPKKVITPGEYYNNVNDAVVFAESLRTLTQKYELRDFDKQIDECIKEISNSIFSICIIGPSRVGKSTLINALTNREMSPVDILPTTGVPILMTPANPEEVVVFFNNDSVKRGPIDLNFISEYAEQKKNKHNQKDVSLIEVRVNSPFLEKGFSITDVPGIDDIDPKIKSIAKSTIYTANAILYVISVAPYKQGEFKITDQHLKDLKEIKEKINKVFLIFNKTDVLTAKEISSLKEYISETLSYYQISDLLAHDPIYISSKKSFEARVLNKKGTDTVRNLEEVIVKYLVNENLNGINNLLANFGKTLELVRQITNICNVRISNSYKNQEIQIKVNKVRSDLKGLQKIIHSQRVKAYEEIEIYISQNFQNVINTLENELKNKPLNKALPNQSEITSYLKVQTDFCVSKVYEYVQQVIFSLQSEINIWVANTLKQVQINLDDITADSTFKLPSIERFTGKLPFLYRIKEQLSSNVLVTTFNFIGKVFSTFYEGIYSLFTSKETLRKKDIQALMDPVHNNFVTIQNDFLNTISNHLNNVCRFIENKTIERTDIYLKVLQEELDSVDTALTEFDKTKIQKLKDELEMLDNKGEQQMICIRDYANGII